MLIIIVSWTIAFFILFSLGDMLIQFYNSYCRQSERYGLLDTFILGICTAIIPLSILSIWMPINHNILFFSITATCVYWFIQPKRLYNHFNQLKNTFHSLTKLQVASLCIIIFSMLIYSNFVESHFDAFYYHYQNIRYIEEYRAIPGLANIEDRFGFNSNYFLLSALFSFRFVVGSGITTLQSLLFMVIILWTLLNIYKSKYDIRYIIFLTFLLLLFITNHQVLIDSSTDIIPFICIFYYLGKTALFPEWYKKNKLLAYLLPVTLITFKLSTIIFALISLILLISLIIKKEKKTIVFFIILAAITLSPWIVRNIIISGYLIYPLYQIDIFSFDWKVPKAVAEMESLYINVWAKHIFNTELNLLSTDLSSKNKVKTLNIIINFLSLIITILSPFILIWICFIKRKLKEFSWWIYSISLLCIGFGLITAPDFRFIGCYTWGCSYLIVIAGLNISKGKIGLKIRSVTTVTLLIFFVLFTFWKNRNYTINYSLSLNAKNTMSILRKPWTLKPEIEFDIYMMDNIPIYIPKDRVDAYDKIPVACDEGLPFKPFNGSKIQGIQTIELRGKDIKDGFKTKPEYINILNNNIKKYKEDFLKQFNEAINKK